MSLIHAEDGFRERRIHDNIINDLLPDEKIYRVIKLEHFFTMLENKTLRLSKPKTWDDTFEDFISSTTFKCPNGEWTTIGTTERFYGQCWTLTKECDGMWRNYSSNTLDNGVRIETTVQKLLNVIYNLNDSNTYLSSFIGKVNYVTEEELLSFLKKMGKDLCSNEIPYFVDSTNKRNTNMLLIKREEFSYEKEVRLLYQDKHRDKFSDDEQIFFHINPVELIESIMFSPKMPNKNVAENMEKLVKEHGFNIDIIKKSTLYKKFEITI